MFKPILYFLSKIIRSRREIVSAKYIRRLRFEYIETYSLLRGSDYEKEETLGWEELLKLRDRKKAYKLDLNQKKRLKECEKLYGRTQHLIDEEGQFHSSSRKLSTIKSGDPKIERLRSILQIRFEQALGAMCAPVYRDAIVFYNSKHQIVSTLDVCLGCEYMAGNRKKEIIADVKTYELLRQFFKDCGHPVEDGE